VSVKTHYAGTGAHRACCALFIRNRRRTCQPGFFLCLTDVDT
jgi:hypothetical protein